MDERVLADAQLLWDYHRLNEPAGEAELIVGLGSYDGAVAAHAASLFLAGKAPWLLFSGGITRRRDLLKNPWRRSEAEEFRDIAVGCGVPDDRIILEPASTNTGENFRFSLAKLAELGIPHASLIVVTKPYMERRARATGRVHLGARRFTMASEPCSLADYCRRFDHSMIVNLMVGDFQRIRLYPALGFQAAEEIPDHIEKAFQRLVAAGYNQHLIDAAATR